VTVEWRPALGAVPGEAGTRFTVWAPDAGGVEVEVRDGGYLRRPLERSSDGTFTATLDEARAGARYRYFVDGRGPFPDPASRFQPEGVHGPSEVVDPRGFAWSDGDWRGVGIDELVVYELHVGTFTPEGTFTAAAAKLPALARLGITAVELMPLADFPGGRSWGYDGVALFAPARCYGRPDDLRGFVDAAHGLGLGVLIDVVYNHLGPDGAYHGQFSPYYYSDRESPWGRAMNLDGPHAGMVRRFFIENALHWIHEYHADGLRLDATHALADRSDTHFLAELAARVRAEAPPPRRLVVAEDHRNLALMVRQPEDGGWGLDGVWADDFHHQVRRMVAGDSDGYYADFTGTSDDLAATIRKGWFFCGQHSEYLGRPRGSDPAGVTLSRFVVCVQNHDQVGNRAFGERLHHQVPLDVYRAVSALLAVVPETPLLFMGQEWAASTPFRYFTDHHDELGRLVTEGRRREFQRFAAFADPEARSSIPDPQASTTFEASRLRWAERDDEPHASVLRLHEALFGLRRREPALRAPGPGLADVVALDAGTLLVRRVSPESGSTIVLAARLQGAGEVTIDPLARGGVPWAWTVRLSTEEAPYAPDPRAIDVELGEASALLRFARPGAVILKGVRR
jgi:maltooligosyltrehalose trehalohydrolase